MSDVDSWSSASSPGGGGGWSGGSGGSWDLITPQQLKRAAKTVRDANK